MRSGSRKNSLRRRRVLDQLHKLIAEDDLSGRDREITADLVNNGSVGEKARRRSPRVVDEICIALHEIETARLLSASKDEWVKQRMVRWRPNIQHLPRYECNALSIPVRHAANLVNGGVPPTLGREKGLLPKHEGQSPPAGIGEPVIVALWRERRLR